MMQGQSRTGAQIQSTELAWKKMLLEEAWFEVIAKTLFHSFGGTYIKQMWLR